MALIDSNNFITHLVWSGLIDKATCGELKEAIELCTVKDTFSKDEVITMLTDLKQDFIAESWSLASYVEDANMTELVVDICDVDKVIRHKINELKEQNDYGKK